MYFLCKYLYTYMFPELRVYKGTSQSIVPDLSYCEVIVVLVDRGSKTRGHVKRLFTLVPRIFFTRFFICSIRTSLNVTVFHSFTIFVLFFLSHMVFRNTQSVFLWVTGVYLVKLVVLFYHNLILDFIFYRYSNMTIFIRKFIYRRLSI